MSKPYRSPPRGRPVAELDRLLFGEPSAFCFSIECTAEPGTMARVLEQFARRGLMPTRWYGDIIAETGRLQIDIQVAGLAAEAGEQVARGLRAIVGLEQVVTGSKS